MKRLSRKYLGNRWRSQRNEKDTARIHNGTVQPASGALPIARFKGDVKNSDFLIDAKVTGGKSFAVNASAFAKLRKEAFINRREPMIRIEFADLILCVVEEKTLLKLVNTKG